MKKKKRLTLFNQVDADTKVLPDALTYMVAAMANDITIMGLCGETRIANKRTSCKFLTETEH